LSDTRTTRYWGSSIDTKQRFLEQLRERLGKFGLELHPEKTRLIEFGRYAAERRKAHGKGKPETFNFLGFSVLQCTEQRVVPDTSYQPRPKAIPEEIKFDIRVLALAVPVFAVDDSNHNGGAGKTTTAVHLAAYLQALDLTLLIDGASVEQSRTVQLAWTDHYGLHGVPGFQRQIAFFV
jgi:hypothetical protein